MNWSDRRLAVLGALALASLFCCALVAARIAYTGIPNFIYLVWNLFLAWVPFVLALAVYDRHRRGAPVPLQVALSALWLLFFPNAPYIVTDFVHLSHDPVAPFWFDAMAICSFAWTGLCLGFASLYLMQVVVRNAIGALASWLVVGGALVLGSVGIYVGRFLRLNSWDVLFDPHLFASLVRFRLADPLGNPKLLGVTLLFTAFLGLAYLVLYSLAGARLELEAADRSR